MTKIAIIYPNKPLKRFNKPINQNEVIVSETQKALRNLSEINQILDSHPQISPKEWFNLKIVRDSLIKLLELP